MNNWELVISYHEPHEQEGKTMLINNNEYFAVLEDIKTRIKTAQYKAALGANREQIILYWNI